MQNDTVTISGVVKASTEAAILFSDGEVICWLPRSQIGGLEPPLIEDEEVALIIPEWLADEKGL